MWFEATKFVAIRYSSETSLITLVVCVLAARGSQLPLSSENCHRQNMSHFAQGFEMTSIMGGGGKPTDTKGWPQGRTNW